MKFKYKVMLYMTAFLSFFYVVSACLLIFVSFQMSLNKEKANALNAYRMIQNMLLVSNDMNQKAYTYTLNQLASQNDSMWKGIRLKQTGSGTLYYENGYLPYHLNDEDIRTMKTEECCFIRYIQTEDGQYIQVSGLVETGSVPLSLEVSQDVTQVYTARETQLQIYKVILAFVLTAGSVSALLIAEKLTKPIRQLSDVSKKITDGNLSIRADIHSGDEIELLARDFNRMTDTIEDNMHQMADAMKRQEEFMGSFAHELKTPMTSIIGYADLMRSQALDEEEQQEAAEYIFSEGRRLESLSLKLLDLLVLKKKDFEVIEAADGEEALDIFFKDKSISLIICDVMMPKINGFDVVKEIRQYSQVPIIMLTAKGEESDELNGFDLGVDEYISKPFSPKILVARVEAILRRSNNLSTGEVLKAGGIELDIAAHEVRIDGKEITLSFKEFELLNYFVVNQGVALSREKILNNVWNYDYFGDARTIDTHVKKLRSKLGEKGEYIKTIWGMGYKFEVD